MTKRGALIKHQNACEAAVDMQLSYDYKRGLYKTPIVYWWKENEFCMEYLNGAVPMAHYLSQKETYILEREAHRMISEVFLSWSIFQPFDGNNFIGKIQHVISRLKNAEDIKLAEKVGGVIKPEYNFPSGEYHGDFTMANVLYLKDQPYLIDFLPGFIGSVVLDIAKLKQEYKVKWCHWIMPCDSSYWHFIAILKEMAEANFNGIDTTHVEAVNLLRILPYVQKENLRNVLRNHINDLL